MFRLIIVYLLPLLRVLSQNRNKTSLEEQGRWRSIPYGFDRVGRHFHNPTRKPVGNAVPPIISLRWELTSKSWKGLFTGTFGKCKKRVFFHSFLSAWVLVVVRETLGGSHRGLQNPYTEICSLGAFMTSHFRTPHHLLRSPSQMPLEPATGKREFDVKDL